MRIKPSKAGLFCGWRFVDVFKYEQFLSGQALQFFTWTDTFA